MGKKRIIVSVINDLVTDQRIRKVCEALDEMNFDVLLVGRKLPKSLPMPKTSYSIKRMSLFFKTGGFFYAEFNIRLFLFLLFSKFDVLLANDLDTLLANTLVKKIRPKKVLVYDSHEYFTGVPELINRPSIQKIWKRIEKFCFPNIDRMYTVNKSICDLYREEYKISPEVVRNISDFNSSTEKQTRNELGLPENKFIIILQGAGINVDRGAEEMIAAMEYISDALLVIVGSGDAIPLLREQVKINNLEEKVAFIGKKPYNTMMTFTRNADLGISLDKNTNINYQYSLPNKIFDYLHAGIPSLVSNLVEVRRIIETYRIGLVIAEVTPRVIASAVNKLKADEALISKLKTNTTAAKKELNWENEKRVLKEIFES